MKIPHVKPFRAVITMLTFALCAARISAQTGASAELDADGWSVLNLRPEGRIFYVSNSGSDGNNGRSPETPFKTIQWGMMRMAAGDWLLLKRGEVFEQAINGSLKNGPSAEHKTVFGAYGDPADPRPIIDPPGVISGMAYHSGDTNGQPVKNIAVVSLHFYQRDRDPSSPHYIAGQHGGPAIQFTPNGEELLFEDLRMEFFTSGINLMGDPGRSEGGYRNISKVTIRRCTIANNYSAVTGSHSQGMYFNAIFNYLIEENLFDHNGHHPTVSNAVPTIFNHNMYVQGTSGPNALVRHNIIARASSHGIQQRPGGSVVENVFIHNGIAGFVADNLITSASEKIVMNDNVVLEAASWALRDDNGNFGVRGWGIQLEGSDGPMVPGTVEMKNNIVANGGSQARSAYGVHSKYQSTAVNTGNITYNWGSSSNSPGPFPNSSRTSGSYNATVGGQASMSAYLAAVGQQRKGAWNPAYGWRPIHTYIREGFGKMGLIASVTGVQVLPESVSIYPDQTEQLTASVFPFDAEDKEVVWSSDNPSVATVDTSEGIVTAIGVGTATITATTVDGDYTDTCIVTVVSAPQNFWSRIGASLESEATGTYASAWFGYFKELEVWNGAWIQHEGLDWLYTGAVTGENVWVWSPHIETWIYTSEDHFPWVWVREDAESSWTDAHGSGWMYLALQEGSASGWLYSLAQENWIRVIP